MARINLKTKMSLAVSLIVAVLMSGLSAIVIFHFRQYSKETIAAQEFALVGEMARNIDESIRHTHKLIIAKAAALNGHSLATPDVARHELETESELAAIFDNGIFLFSRSGIMLSEYPDHDRQGNNFAYREYFQKTLESGKPYISPPYLSSQSHNHPAVMFTAPVFGTDGTIIAVLAGSIDLLRDNSLARYANAKIGKTGYVYLYNTDRTIIMHPDQSRIMKKDEPFGVNKVFDKGITGFEGTEENVNSRGLHALTSVKQLKSVNWIIGANYPLADAYAPIRKATRYAIMATIIGIVLSSLAVSIGMRFLTASLSKLTAHIRNISEHEGTEKSILIRSGDEIEVLALSFNTLMATIDREQDKLQELSSSLARSLEETEREKVRSEAFITAIGQMVSVQDADFRIIYQNDVIRNLMGEHVGEQCYKAYQNQDTVCDGCAMADAFKDGQVHCAEKDFNLPGGKHLFAEYTVSPVRDAAGNVVAAVELIHDISEHKNMEFKLASQYAVSSILAESPTVEDAIPHLLESICEAIGWDIGDIWWLDQRGEHLSLIDMWHRKGLETAPFEAMSRETSFSPGIGLAGRVWASGSALWIPDVLSEQSFLRRSVAEACGLQSAFAFPIILGGKTVGVMEFYSCKPREHDLGLLEAMAPLGSQLGQLIERKHAEQALRESQQQLTNVIEFLPDATIVIDRDKRVIFWNRAIEEMTGVSKTEILGKGDYAYSVPFYGRARPTLLDLLDVDAAVLASRYQNISYVGNTLFAETYAPALHGGQGAYLWVSGTALYDTTGKRVGAIEVIRDITDRKMMELTLTEATRHADDANMAKSEFLASMSHEIRTPMNGVIGMTSLLLSTELNRTQREYAEVIRASGKSLLSLINDILDFSKIEAHKIELESSTFELHALVAETIGLLAPQAAEKGLLLHEWSDPGVPNLLKGDSARLRQVITNLIGNSIKFTPTGSVHLLIWKEREDERKYNLNFYVCDSGIGIPADKLEQIFDPFTQADGSTTRRFGGTGLGLAICKKLVELMGGELHVKSTVGHGSVFYFTITFEKPAETDSQPLAAISEPARSTELFARPSDFRLLVAEDDPVNVKVARAFLAQLGYRVDIVSNGIQAVEALKMHDYDLVLMDCMMPVMGGFEATSVIRDPYSGVRNHHMPVIAITARALKDDREKCIAAGMNDYLSKPIELAELKGVLRKWLTPGKPEVDGLRDVPEPVTEEENRDIFDPDKFVRRNLNDRDLSREVAIIFLNSGEEYLSSIRNAITAADSAELRLCAHKLKGAAANFSLSRLCEISGEIENIAASGRTDGANELLPELEQRFEQAATALRHLLISPADKIFA